jgi:AraC-like DNA-binding protein
MRLDAAESELGRWRTAHRRAAPALQPYVRAFFGSDSFLPATLRERHLPSAGVSLVVNFATPHRLIEREACDMGWGRRAWVVGLQTAPRAAEAVGERDFLAAQLTPTGARRLLRTPMHTIADRVLDLEDIDAAFARRLLGRVGNAKGWVERIDALEAVLVERLSDEPASPTPIVAAALARLSSSEAKVDLGRLAAELGRSHRYLIAQFRDQVGLPPKAMARLLRFNRALAAINADARPGHPDGKPYLEGVASDDLAAAPAWTDLALGCGYYDQAHFINEFRAFAGCPPGAFLRELSGEGREPRGL